MPYRRTKLVALVVVSLCLTVPLSAGSPRHVILLISDGAGFNTFHAASYYQHGKLGQQPYDAWPVRLACSTYMLNDDGTPAGYDAQAAWASFDAVRGTADTTVATDSAAAATALYTGAKTLRGRIGEDREAAALPTLADIAHAQGLGTGVVTSVQFAHATPAALAAHNEHRNNYVAIANEMIFGSDLDVIMGCGHPEYDKNGRPRPTDPDKYKYVGGQATWDALCKGQTGKGWTLVQSRSDFQALADNPALAPRRVIGVPQVYKTLQYERDGRGMGNLNPDVPDLATMTAAALNVLHRNTQGFLLVVEAGAVDWANHDSDLARSIEEQIDFDRTVAAVVRWIETNSSWDDALVIVTADHECGHLWGPNAGPPAKFSPIVRAEAGTLPKAEYYSDYHTNSLVPLYARGAGAEAFLSCIGGKDPVYGPYVDNTDIFRVIRDALVPAPAASAARSEGQ